MKRILVAVASALAVAATAQFSALRLVAQDAANRGTTRNSATSDANASSDQASIGKLDRRTSGSNVRASQLIGANIQNDNGESVGEINDLVIDGNSGRVRYAAVTYGGFLGMGSKLFAVPFEAFHVKPKSANSNDYVLVLNVTKDQLKGAEGFDKDRWPDFADRNFTRELERRYNVDRTANRSRGAGRGAGRNRAGTNTERPVDTAAGPGTGAGTR
jgi:sporulation protein YlmC with PRC-barrel domain